MTQPQQTHLWDTRASMLEDGRLQRRPQTNGSDALSDNQQISDFEAPLIYVTFSSSLRFCFLTVHVVLSSSMSADAQRGVVLKVSSVRVKRDREMLKSSKAPPCPPPPSLRVALLPLPPDTEMGPLLPKRPVRLRARQAPPPLRLKLTRGALTTLIVGLVS